jgi:hypothetical protein
VTCSDASASTALSLRSAGCALLSPRTAGRHRNKSGAGFLRVVGVHAEAEAHAQYTFSHRLRGDIPRQRASRFDLPAQAFRVHIETVRPGRRPVLKEYAGKVCGVAQRLDHRAGLGDQRGEIVFARRSVAERRVQTIAAEVFDFGDLNHHRVLRERERVSTSLSRRRPKT